jgi:hypothetical protein
MTLTPEAQSVARVMESSLRSKLLLNSKSMPQHLIAANQSKKRSKLLGTAHR